MYFATSRTYDEAEGAELLPSREGDADFRITSDPPEGCITVMAIVPPDKLVLCVDEFILQDDRARVLAVVRGAAARLHAGAARARRGDRRR